MKIKKKCKNDCQTFQSPCHDNHGNKMEIGMPTTVKGKCT